MGSYLCIHREWSDCSVQSGFPKWVEILVAAMLAGIEPSFVSLRHTAVFTNSSWLIFAINMETIDKTNGIINCCSSWITSASLQRLFIEWKEAKDLTYLPLSTNQAHNSRVSRTRKMQFNWQKQLYRKRLSKGNISVWGKCVRHHSC